MEVSISIACFPRLSVTLGFDGERNFSLSTSACQSKENSAIYLFLFLCFYWAIYIVHCNVKQQYHECEIGFHYTMWTPSGTYQPFYSLTDAVAMDCEMVGVGQGNKSALGRVTLVFISSSLCIYYTFFYKLLSSLRLVTCPTFVVHSWKWFHLMYTLFDYHLFIVWAIERDLWPYICWLSLFVGTLLRVLHG